MRSRNRLSQIVASAPVLIACVSGHAASVNPPIGFDSDSTEGWIAGRAFVNPIVQADGGPQGDGDPFLQVTSSGANGPGSIAAVFNNGEDWTGDFTTPGITGLSLDMMNPITSNVLELRMVLFGPNSLGDRWTSTDAISVANDGVWRNYVFPIDAAAFTQVRGSATIDAVLSGADRIMLRHDPGGPSAGGAASRAELGIDNIGFLAGLFGDYNGSGDFDVGDLDVQAAGIVANDPAFDIDGDGDADIDDRFNWVRNIQGSWVGDSNFDGEFNSTDFVAVFSVGKYETGTAATYAEGDWNGDLLFDSSDFVVAFQDGGYEKGPLEIAEVPEPSAALVALVGLIPFLRLRLSSTIANNLERHEGHVVGHFLPVNQL